MTGQTLPINCLLNNVSKNIPEIIEEADSDINTDSSEDEMSDDVLKQKQMQKGINTNIKMDGLKNLQEMQLSHEVQKNSVPENDIEDAANKDVQNLFIKEISGSRHDRALPRKMIDNANRQHTEYKINQIMHKGDSQSSNSGSSDKVKDDKSQYETVPVEQECGGSDKNENFNWLKSLENKTKDAQKTVSKPNLSTPTKGLFNIHKSYSKLGDNSPKPAQINSPKLGPGQMRINSPQKKNLKQVNFSLMGPKQANLKSSLDCITDPEKKIFHSKSFSTIEDPNKKLVPQPAFVKNYLQKQKKKPQNQL